MAEHRDNLVEPWKPGMSGNPKGRPPKDRAMTSLLEAAGRKKLRTAGGKLVPRNVVLAELVWEAVTLGRIEMPDGLPRILAPKEWIDIVKFIYGQIDGPPKATMDVNVMIRREAERLAEQHPDLVVDDLIRTAEELMREARVT